MDTVTVNKQELFKYLLPRYTSTIKIQAFSLAHQPQYARKSKTITNKCSRRVPWMWTSIIEWLESNQIIPMLQPAFPNRSLLGLHVNIGQHPFHSKLRKRTCEPCTVKKSITLISIFKKKLCGYFTANNRTITCLQLRKKKWINEAVEQTARNY